MLGYKCPHWPGFFHALDVIRSRWCVRTERTGPRHRDHHTFPVPSTHSQPCEARTGTPSQEATMIDMKPCHQCGTLLTPALADAVNNPAAPETCPTA